MEIINKIKGSLENLVKFEAKRASIFLAYLALNSTALSSWFDCSKILALKTMDCKIIEKLSVSI